MSETYIIFAQALIHTEVKVKPRKQKLRMPVPKVAASHFIRDKRSDGLLPEATAAF